MANSTDDGVEDGASHALVDAVVHALSSGLGLSEHGRESEVSFAKRVSELTIRKVVPSALRSAASRCEAEDMAEHAASLEEAASRCEAEGTKEAAERASRCVEAFLRGLSRTDWSPAACAVAMRALQSTHNALWSAKCAEERSVSAAVDCAAWSVESAARAAEDTDAFLSEFAEDVVQILCELRAVGAQFLHLTEEAK